MEGYGELMRAGRLAGVGDWRPERTGRCPTRSSYTKGLTNERCNISGADIVAVEKPGSTKTYGSLGRQ